MNRWNGYANERKALYPKSWKGIAEERNRFNACMTVPSALIKDIIGWGRDADGKRFRYSPH